MLVLIKVVVEGGLERVALIPRQNLLCADASRERPALAKNLVHQSLNNELDNLPTFFGAPVTGQFSDHHVRADDGGTCQRTCA